MGNEYKFRNWIIPELMLAALRRYVDQGIPTGDFLRCIISNDFVHAAGYADDVNLNNLPAYAAYMYNEMPGGSYGTKEIYNEWISAKRIERETAQAYYKETQSGT